MANSGPTASSLVLATPSDQHAAAMPIRQQRADAVRVAKTMKLNCGEGFCKWLALIPLLPTLGLAGLKVIPPRTTLALFRFGKLDRVYSKPGLTWILPGGDLIWAFTGTQTFKLDSLNVIDAAGNPIIIRALLEYAIEDPAALHIAVNDSLAVLHNQAEQVVREACSRLPLLGEHGADIRSQTHEICAAMVKELQLDATSYGVAVQRLTILEARYAPEIASQMLMKQQAAAMVAARREIVAGALNVVHDTLMSFPTLSDASRERLVTNLLVTLTSHVPTTPVVAM